MAEYFLSGYKLIRSYIGIIFVVAGIILLCPLIMLIWTPEEIKYLPCFLIPAVSSIILGSILSYPLRKRPKEQLSRNQDSIIVVLAWIVVIFVSSIPFMLSGEYRFLHSLFESVSGYSTVGITVMDVEKMPHVFLLFRTLMLFFGGIGIVLVLTSLVSGYYGMKLYIAEGHNDRMLPNLIKSVRLIIIFYLSYIGIGTLLYVFFGMSWFDAINHAIAAVSTGGFSTKKEGIAFFDSGAIEYVTVILMLLGSMSFILHLALIKGDWKNIIRHCETKYVFFVLLLMVPIVGVFFNNSNIEHPFREALFNTVATITTTGFQTVPTENFATPIVVVLLVLMLIGGGAGSTSGGIKQYRVCVLMKDFFWYLKERLSSDRIIKPNQIHRYGNLIKVSDKEKLDLGNFALLYLSTFIIGAFLFSCFGYSLKDSMVEFAGIISGTGLSSGIVNIFAKPPILIIAMVGMFIGRLEIYIVLLAFIKLIDDAKNAIIKD